MRIASRGQMDLLKRNLTIPAERIAKLQVQLASGKRLQTLSDDPLAASRTVRARAGLQEIGARKFVIQHGQSLLSATDSALGEMAGLLKNARNIGLRACTLSLDPAERDALAAQVRALSSSLVSEGNTEVQGQYLFGGTKTATPPLQESSTANLPVLYHGSGAPPQYRISAWEQATIGFNGAEVFNYPDSTGERPVSGVDRDVFSLLDDLAVAIERNDSAQLQTLTAQVLDCQEHVIDLRGRAGVVSQRLNRGLDAAEAADIRLHELLSNVESVDFAAAMVDLSNEQVIYQAALRTTSTLLDMPNLFDVQQ